MRQESETDIVLITGCSSGIGHALALALHRQGCKVLATARKLEALADLAAEGMEVCALDVTVEDSRQALLRHVQTHHWQVDTLINNAGYGAMGPLLDMDESAWQAQFAVNLFAPMQLARLLAPMMVRRGRGRIVNISSVSGILTTPFAGAYCASKAAFTAASDALRMELAAFGVRVITVQPGAIRSAFGGNAQAAIRLAPDSLYQGIKAAVLARAGASQEGATPAEVFAQELSRHLLAPSCPPILRLGNKSRIMPWMKALLPTARLDKMLRQRFQLDRLRFVQPE